MALNLSPGEESVAQETVGPIDPQAPVIESTETAPAPPEQTTIGDAPVPEGEGTAEVPIADATEQPPAASFAPSVDGQPVTEAATETATAEQPEPSAGEDVTPVNDDVHDLIDELEELIGRAHHFENAGIERLRAGGLALIERIRNVI